MKQNLGYIIAAVLTLIPLGLWTQSETFPYKFVDASSTFTSLGQIAALAGMALFAISLLFSLRLRVFESWFGGMNRVYIAHHLIGGIAFLLLLTHPLFLMAGYWKISLHDAVVFILPGTDWTVNMGRITLLSLMLLLVITYYMDLPYQLWRLTHKFMGLAFFFGGLHGLFISSDIARTPLLRDYMLVLCGGALVGYCYRTLLGRFLVHRVLYVLDGVRILKNNSIELSLRPVKNPIQFQPGQFLFISFTGKGIDNETHPFSICSAPNPAQLMLTVKALGDYTNSLVKLVPGTIAKIEGPFGAFSYLRYPGKRQIWIAGGIGVTPFISMARTINEKSPKIDCYYALHDESEAVYLDEMAQISTQFPQFQVYPVYSSIHGRITADMVASISADYLTADIFLCGPPPMMMSLKKQFRQKGISSAKIHSEEFAMQ